MAMPLKDLSDTWVSATTFIYTLNVHLQGPRGSHHMLLVASPGTAAGKACAPQGSPTKQSVCLG
jgi:hypothetical protein